MVEKKVQIKHPLCFNEIKKKSTNKSEDKKYFKNKFYSESKFNPISFYKVIIKL